MPDHDRVERFLKSLPPIMRHDASFLLSPRQSFPATDVERAWFDAPPRLHPEVMPPVAGAGALARLGFALFCILVASVPLYVAVRLAVEMGRAR